MAGLAVHLDMGRAERKRRIPFMGKQIGGPLCSRCMATLALRRTALAELAAVYILMAGRALGGCRSVLNNLFFSMRYCMALDAVRIGMSLALKESAHVLMPVRFNPEGRKISLVTYGAVVFKHFLLELPIVRIGVARLA